MRSSIESMFLIRMPFWGALFALYSGKFRIAKDILIKKEKIKIKPLPPPNTKIFYLDYHYDRR